MSNEAMTVEELLGRIASLRTRWKIITKQAVLVGEDFAAELASGIVLSLSGIMDAVEAINSACPLLPVQINAVLDAALDINSYGSAHVQRVGKGKIEELVNRKGNGKDETGIQYD